MNEKFGPIKTGSPRVFAAMGPGDLVHSFEMWSQGRSVASETSITFSSQFFDACRDMDATVWAISSNPSTRTLTEAHFIVEHRPKVWREKGGAWFHLSQAQYAFSLVLSAIRFRPDIILLDSGTTHYFLMTLFRIASARVVPNHHNTIWPVCNPPTTAVERSITFLDSLFFRWFATVAMGVSPECEAQARQLAGRAIPFLQYRTQYRAEDFDFIPKPDFSANPLRILFAGRMERNKGVYDLLEVALLLKRRGRPVFFEVCGKGEALEEFRRRIEQDDLSDVVVAHGYLNRSELLKVYSRSHLSIVPTRSDFAEGLPQASAEAALAGRPILTSAANPALAVLGPICLVAEVNNPRSYADEVERVMNDRNMLRRLSGECKKLSGQFLDRRKGYSSALKELFNLCGIGG